MKAIWKISWLKWILLLIFAEHRKPVVPPRAKTTAKPQLPENPAASAELLRNTGHCLYDLTDFFAITLVSVSNVGMQDFTMVSLMILLSILFH